MDKDDFGFVPAEAYDDLGFVPADQYESSVPAPSSANQEPSLVEDLARAGLEGASFGGSGEIIGGVKAILDVATTDAKLSDLTKLYRQYQQLGEQKLQEAQQRNPNLMTAAEIAGGFLVPGLGTAGAMGKAATVGGKAMAAAKSGALVGGLTGIGKSEYTLEEPVELAKEAASSAAFGGGLGGLVGGSAALAGKGSEGLETFIKKSKFGKNLEQGFTQGEKNLGYFTNESRDRVAAETKKATDELIDLIGSSKDKEMTGLLGETSEQFGNFMKKAGETGVKVKGSDNESFKKLIQSAGGKIVSATDESSLLSGGLPKTKTIVTDIGDDEFRSALMKYLNNEMTPQEAYNFGQKIQDKGYLATSSVKTTEALESVAKAAGQQLKETAKQTAASISPEATEAFQKFKDVRAYLPDTLLNPNVPLKDQLIKSKDFTGPELRAKLEKEIKDIIENIGRPTGSTKVIEMDAQLKLLKSRIDELNKLYPNLNIDGDEIIKKLEFVGRELEIFKRINTQQGDQASAGGVINNLMGTVGYGTANIAGQMPIISKSIRGSIKLANAGNNLAKMSDDTLLQVAGYLKSGPAQHLGKALEDAITSGGSGSASKNAAIFAIMQNKEARQLLSNVMSDDEEDNK